MNDVLSVEFKRELCIKMGSNLPTLRKKVNMSQKVMAEKLGLSRITISKIESKKQVMQWRTFSLSVMVFSKNDEIKQIMVAMGLINDDVEKAINIREDSL